MANQSLPAVLSSWLISDISQGSACAKSRKLPATLSPTSTSLSLSSAGAQTRNQVPRCPRWQVYKVPVRLFEAAGYVDSAVCDRRRCPFEQVLADPEFQFGTRFKESELDQVMDTGSPRPRHNRRSLPTNRKEAPARCSRLKSLSFTNLPAPTSETRRITTMSDTEDLAEAFRAYFQSASISNAHRLQRLCRSIGGHVERPLAQRAGASTVSIFSRGKRARDPYSRGPQTYARRDYPLPRDP